MLENGPHRFRTTGWQFICLVLAACLVTTSLVAVPAQAQEQGFFQRLFGGDKRPRVTEPRQPAPRQRRQRRTQPAAPAAPEIPIVEKAEDARPVLVVGDFLASGLAEGLETAFANEPGVRIVDKTSGSSGFVRDDYYNWPAEIPAILDSEKPAAVVLMIGANDGQQMQLEAGREEPLTDPWTSEYQRRASEFADAVRSRDIPLIWVGPPSFRLGKLSSYMVGLNDIFKSISEARGAEFIDIWEGFVDESGAFTATGPDVNGQQVRLRASDGINMTRAGRQKMAFYAEKPLRRLLGDLSIPGDDSLAPDELPGAGPRHPVNVDRTPPISLSDPELDGGLVLLGADLLPEPEYDAEKSPRDLLVIEGIAPKPQPGRADAFAAGSAGDDSDVAARPVTDTTSAIRR